MKYTDLEYVEWTKREDKTELNKDRQGHRYIFRLTKRERERNGERERERDNRNQRSQIMIPFQFHEELMHINIKVFSRLWSHIIQTYLILHLKYQQLN